MGNDDYWDGVARKTAERLLNILEDWYGAGVALSKLELTQQLRCNDSVLRAAIRHLRQAGHLVVAAEKGGYRLAHSEEEVQRYLDSLRSRIAGVQETIEAMETSLAQRKYGQQGRLM